MIPSHGNNRRCTEMFMFLDVYCSVTVIGKKLFSDVIGKL